MTLTSTSTRTLTYAEAVNDAIRLAMRNDPNVIFLGEDVAGGAGVDHLEDDEAWGGAFGVTKGLVQEFGRERVLDTPITESASSAPRRAGRDRPASDCGADVRRLLRGLPMDQIFDQAAKLRYMFGGKARCPIVIRTTIGAGLDAAAHHSGCHYSVFTHMPGIKVGYAVDSGGCQGAVARRYPRRRSCGGVRAQAVVWDVGRGPGSRQSDSTRPADVKREGGDVTIVGISRMVHLAFDAAEELAAEDVSAEVLDPRTLSPLDTDAIFASVAKTHRLVIVDEDNPLCSVAATIAAVVADEGFDYLDGPIKSVTAPHTPVPFSPPLEAAYIPSPERIADAVREIV